MTKITTSCPACKKTYELDQEKFEGKSVTCSGCKQKFVVSRDKSHETESEIVADVEANPKKKMSSGKMDAIFSMVVSYVVFLIMAALFLGVVFLCFYSLDQQLFERFKDDATPGATVNTLRRIEELLRAIGRVVMIWFCWKVLTKFYWLFNKISNYENAKDWIS